MEQPKRDQFGRFVGQSAEEKLLAKCEKLSALVDRVLKLDDDDPQKWRHIAVLRRRLQSALLELDLLSTPEVGANGQH